LAGIYLGGCGDNSVIEVAEIGFPPPGDTGRHDAQRWRNLQPSWRQGLKEMALTGQRGTGQYCQVQCCQVYSLFLVFINVGVNRPVEETLICPCPTKQRLCHIISSITAILRHMRPSELSSWAPIGKQILPRTEAELVRASPSSGTYRPR
jgi:hypothetical protein